MLTSYRGFDAFAGPGGCGPTGSSWRCGPCERESELEGYYAGFGQTGVTAGATTAALSLDKNVTALQGVIMGVATGVTVWALTRFLEKKLKKGRR